MIRLSPSPSSLSLPSMRALYDEKGLLQPSSKETAPCLCDSGFPQVGDMCMVLKD